MKNNLIFVILGKSGAGKTMLAKDLSEYFGYKKIVSSTSRPPREKEVNGIDYYFKTEEELINLSKENKLVAFNNYNGWYYATEKESIDRVNNHCILVLEPQGYKSCKEAYGDRVVGIYIDVSDKNRLLRALNREVNPDCHEICRRLIADTEDFKEIENDKSIIKIDNNNSLPYTIECLTQVVTDSLNNRF